MKAVNKLANRYSRYFDDDNEPIDLNGHGNIMIQTMLNQTKQNKPHQNAPVKKDAKPPKKRSRLEQILPLGVNAGNYLK